MERMTYVKHPRSWNRGKYPTKYTSRHTFQEVVARLAAYEDTGLTPEEVGRLATLASGGAHPAFRRLITQLKLTEPDRQPSAAQEVGL